MNGTHTYVCVYVFAACLWYVLYFTHNLTAWVTQAKKSLMTFIIQPLTPLQTFLNTLVKNPQFYKRPLSHSPWNILYPWINLVKRCCITLNNLHLYVPMGKELCIRKVRRTHIGVWHFPQKVFKPRDVNGTLTASRWRETKLILLISL